MASSTLEQAIEAYLRQQSSITALVQNKVYWLMADERATYPYIIYKTVTGTSTDTRIGQTSGRQALVQFDIYGKDKIKLLNIGNALITVFNQFSGSMDGLNVFISTTGIVRPVHEPEAGIFHFILEVDFDYKE